MSKVLFKFSGGFITLPSLILIDRNDGGNLVVMPASKVWERSELGKEELFNWSCLVAATGKAMLDVLPQLENGCINYWEAGNWALNAMAEPVGQKNAIDHRIVHMHLLGRNPRSKNLETLWGEAPIFPMFQDARNWAAKNAPLTSKECKSVVNRVQEILFEKYGINS